MNPNDIQTKYSESFEFTQAKKKRQAEQIALLNNLQRGDQNISSTLLMTLFNRVMSNSYDDKIQVKFVPNEEIEQKQVASLNILAQNDYQQMDMKRHDYDWTWDTLFFGRGYIETLRFDKKQKLMRPSVINPLAFGYDPYFSDPQQWRYYWKWVIKSGVEIDYLIKAGMLKDVEKADDLPSGVEPYLWQYNAVKERAKGVTPPAGDSHQGDIYQILEFYGYDTDGDKCVSWLDKDLSRVLYEEKLDLRDGEDVFGPSNQVVRTGSKWPIVVKEAFREPHSSVQFSVADLLEDKHRARSVLLNLAYFAAKDKANPIYQYNPTLVDDVSQLFNRQINQHIPVSDVQKAIAPLNTDTALDPTLAAFLQVLTQEASDPVGGNLQASPAEKGKQTATHDAIQQQLSDMAQSLQSKVMQFGVEEFWGMWYNRYKRYTKAGDMKTATVMGTNGVDFERIDLGDIRTKYPPGVHVFSAKEAEYKDLVERRDLMEMYPAFQSSLTPDGMRSFNKYVFFPKFLSDPATISTLFPDSVDEIKAQEENERMSSKELPEVSPTDNHEQHLAVHRMAGNTWGKWVHIKWHEELLSQQKKEQQAQAQGAPALSGLQTAMGGAQGGQNPQQGKQSPLGAAASLREETMRSVGQKNAQSSLT